MGAGDESGGGAQEQLETQPDEVLARRMRNGDRDALEQLVRRYLRPVHAVAASYLSEPDEVEDAAQETFLRALRAIDSYDAGRPFASWLYKIARNVARDRVTASARRAEVLPHTLADRTPGPDAELERSELLVRVDAAVARLPEQQRTAFRLCDVDGYSTKEVARIMAISPGTVRSHLHHARKALRAALAEGRDPVRKRRSK